MFFEVSNSLKLSWLHDSDSSIRKCVISLSMDEKGMPFMNFKILNAKNLKIELKKKLLKYGIPIHWD